MRGVEKITGFLDGAKEKTCGVAEKVIGGTADMLDGAKEMTSGVAEKVIGGTAGILDGAKEMTSGVAEKVIGGTARMAQDSNFSERIESIRKRLDESTPDIVKDASRRVAESVDVLTGIKLLEVVQEMLQAQEEYNDILATKLDEALTRIAILEAVIQKGAVDENR